MPPRLPWALALMLALRIAALPSQALAGPAHDDKAPAKSPPAKPTAARIPIDLSGREVTWAGRRTCEIKGHGATLDLVMVTPAGAAPFRLAISGVPATLHLAPPDDARAMHHVTVGGALGFEGQAPGEWAHFVTARSVVAESGMVRLSRGVRLNDVRGVKAKAQMAALATVELEHAVKLPGINIPCNGLALDEPASADGLEPSKDDTDRTSWVARGTRIALRPKPGGQGPAYTVEVQYASALVLSRVRSEGRYLLLDSWQPRVPVAVAGWVDEAEVEGYLPTMRGQAPPVGPVSPPLDGPPPLERGVYEGTAAIAAGTMVYAERGGRGAWASVRDDKVLKVRWKTDERWVEIVAAPGVGGLAGHAFVDRAAVHLPLAPGAWRVTGAPLASRLGHTATLLPGGRVLIVGGWGPMTLDSRGDGKGEGKGDARAEIDPQRRIPLSSVELYDPDGSAERFSPAAPLATGRAGHTATLLDDGRVLVIGGEWLPPAADGIALASAEIYDPVSNTWRSAGTMSEGRIGHSATLLADGTVLVAGGDNGHGRSLGTAELWSPGAAPEGRFRTVGELATRRYDHSATRLPSGKVMIVGGRHKNYALRDWWSTFPVDTIELYDPATRAFQTLGELPSGGRTRHSATLLPAGRVLLAGGARETDLDFAGIARAALVWEPESASWMLSGDTTAREEEARGEHTATALPDGRVVIVSGPFALFFDPVARRWQSFAGPGFERAGHTATLLPGGRLLVVGGEPSDERPSPTRPGAELLQPPAAGP